MPGNDTRPSQSVHAFTLIELLIAMAVIAVLASLLIAAAGAVRRSARTTEAKSTLALLHGAFDAYRQDDAWHRYPCTNPVDASISRLPITPATVGVLELLETMRLFTAHQGRLDDQGRLLDPWLNPWRYTLTRPAAAPVSLVPDWNWDAEAGHERNWGRRRDPISGTTSTGALAFPYIHSLGQDGDADHPDQWIHLTDGK
jgi:prepilin-type N-terminal cleavage/methylation domain-containing protein